MTEPRIVPRNEHPISRRDIDPDALKVLYRLRQFDHIAYLVGGSVRDLLLGRRPKDFDIGTSAHPYQVKKLFRNCWIIGRRFRLAHVKFGEKVIEVATFRRQIVPGEEAVQDAVPAPVLHETVAAAAGGPAQRQAYVDGTDNEHLIHRDNTFGSPEEDAFRRDFTINALFYDIATFSIIDYVGGLDDLHAGLVRAIGDPDVRLCEDPVRMIRAMALAARLDFSIEPALLEAIRTHRREIAKSSPARLLEEYYKILRAGAAEATFRNLAEVGLLESTSGELHRGATDPLWRSLAALDTYRRRFDATPDALSNAILLGSLLAPLGITLHGRRSDDRVRHGGHRDSESEPTARDADAGGQGGLPERPAGPAAPPYPDRRAPGPKLGDLPIARRDVERLRHIIGLQRRLRDLTASPRAQRALTHRHIFREALTWLEIHGDSPDLVEHWKALMGDGAERPAPGVPSTAATLGTPLGAEEDGITVRRPHRRRRRRSRSLKSEV
jgi:tRNA nucleotidyltransferase/poly(A) polymerase